MNLTATASSAVSVALAWTDIATSEVGYLIERALSANGVYTQLALTAANATSYLDVGAVASTAYNYRIRAVNSAGASAYSNIASAMTPAKVAPINFYNYTVTPYSSLDGTGSFVINNANMITLTGDFARKIDCSGNFNENTVMEFTFSSTRQGAIHGVGWDETNDHLDNVRVFQVYGSSVATWANQSYHDYSGSSFKTYIIPIGKIYTGGWTGRREFLAFVNKASSAVPTPTSTIKDIRFYEIYSNGSAPVAPGGLVASAESGVRIDLSWTDASSNENGFVIERSADSGATFSVLGVVGANAVTFSDATANVGTFYCYRVRTGNLAGMSSWTETVSAALSSPAPALNFYNYTMSAYSTLDGTGAATIIGGTEIDFSGNVAKKFDKSGTFSAKTVLEFEFKCTTLGGVHGIGWDETNTHLDNLRVIQLCGSEIASYAIQSYNNYTSIGQWKKYIIPIGQIYTGGWATWREFLVLVSTQASGGGAPASAFRNVKLYDTH